MSFRAAVTTRPIWEPGTPESSNTGSMNWFSTRQTAARTRCGEPRRHSSIDGRRICGPCSCCSAIANLNPQCATLASRWMLLWRSPSRQRSEGCTGRLPAGEACLPDGAVPCGESGRVRRVGHVGDCQLPGAAAYSRSRPLTGACASQSNERMRLIAAFRHPARRLRQRFATWLMIWAKWQD